MTSDIHMEARYFNEKLSVWEPLMEQVSEKEGQYRPWECVVKVKTNKGNTVICNCKKKDLKPNFHTISPGF
jgi:hypothetical protein